MHTILDGACSAIAESGMALKYWANAISTIVYISQMVTYLICGFEKRVLQESSSKV